MPPVAAVALPLMLLSSLLSPAAGIRAPAPAVHDGVHAGRVPAPETSAQLVTVDDRDWAGAENAIYAPSRKTIFIAYKRFLRDPYDPGGDQVPAELCVARSTDAGQTWEVTVLDPRAVEAGDLAEGSVAIDGDGKGAVFISYLRDPTGGIARRSLRLARSVDGGDSWSLSKVARGAGEFERIRVLGRRTALIATDAGFGPGAEVRLYRTTDGGKRWRYRTVQRGTGWYVGMDVAPSGETWVSAYDGTNAVLRAGRSPSPLGPWKMRRVAGKPADDNYTGLWGSLELFRGTAYLGFDDFRPSTTGNVLRVIRSSDGGRTWSRSVVDVGVELGWKTTVRAVRDPGSAGGTGLFVAYWWEREGPDFWGRVRLGHSTDGGSTWSVVTVPEPGFVYPALDLATPGGGRRYISYQAADGLREVAALRFARILDAPAA